MNPVLVSPFQEVTRAHESIALSDLNSFTSEEETFAKSTSAPSLEIEEEVVADIYEMMQAMVSRICEGLAKYQKKANKALKEAKHQYKHKSNPSKALVFMRKYSYYGLRVQYMAAAHQDLQSMLHTVENKFLNVTNTKRALIHVDFDIQGFLLQLGRLQQVFSHIPVSTQEDAELMQELRGALEQDNLSVLGQKKTAPTAWDRNVMFSSIAEED